MISGVKSSAGLTDTVFQTGGSALVGSFAKNLVFVGSNAQATIVGGSGSETVNAGQGGDLIAGGTAGNNFLAGGTGATGSTIFGGGNGDVLMARGGGTSLVVAGAGNETLTGAASTGSTIFFTPLGPASLTSNIMITGGPGNDVYFVGSGRSTVDSGSGGNDIVAIVNGRAGGSVVLSNFQAGTQTVQLQGYRANEATNDLANQTNVNGSAVITLSDNTKLTFVGIAQVTASDF